MPENDLLQNPAFRAPGLGERLRELFLGEKRPLDCVQVEVTSCCAGRCVYCPHTTQTGSWRSRHMPDEVFAALWPLLRRSGRAHLQGWGEPLLHPRFFDFAALARKAGCRVSSTSCGLHMDADLAARLVESGMDMLAFSLVGTDAASNAARAGVSFERVCEAIRMVRAAQRGRSGRAVSGENFPEVHLAYLMLADRIEAAAGLPRLMEELDVRMAVVSTLDYIAAPSQAVLAFAPEETDKIARARAKQIAFDEAFAPEISMKDVEKILGMPKFLKEEYEVGGMTGVVTGLAWTEVGGDILYIESVLTPGKGKVSLTGNLGDVMKESATIAHEWTMAHYKELGIDPKLFETNDINIHVPEGAIPKDGPSAGITICIAVISALTNTPVRRDLAMTGEITLRGRILPIGGLKEKTMAAMRIGITTVIIPRENEKDLEEIDPTVRSALKFVTTDHVDKILDVAFGRRFAAAVKAAHKDAPGDAANVNLRQ